MKLVIKGELAYILSKINIEIKELKYYKIQLKKFLLTEFTKGKLKANEFNKIINELERLSVEIAYLEIKKIEYNNIKELI